ncbi:aldehyde dehydrogenase [Nocardia sp. NPDC127606]|uniref:aldehyde dehydrogenase n=1 Tax=Nocardia sp. NPDC127606 TaxID=3345406 RepID=UPI00362D8FF2
MTSTANLTTVDLLIGGTKIAAEDGAFFVKTQRTTGAKIAQVAAAKAVDSVRAVAAAADAAPEWAGMAPAGRRAVLERAAVLLDERGGEIAAMMGREMGAAAAWCGFNVKLGADMLREAAVQVYAAVGQVIPSNVPGLTALAERKPLGVVVGIAPWNAPIILGVRAIAMPLAFGNTVVLKASEETPATHAAIVQCLIDAGVPAGAVNLITNAPEDAAEVVEALIAHPAVRSVNFTGSTRVGRRIGELAGRHLTRSVLELGGKAPFIVLADADLDEAAAAASFGAFMNQGQICMSTERIIVDRAVADEFAGKLAERARALVVGDPTAPGTQLGPLVHEPAVAHVHALVQDAIEYGATVLTGGEPDGLFYPPTVLTGVVPGARIYTEESFGPVAPIIAVDGVEEAVRVANDSEYGLSAAIFTSDIDLGLQIARRIESGICHINGATVHDEAQMPFGGVKASGYGRFGSQAALEEFTELRWLTVSSEHRHYPI